MSAERFDLARFRLPLKRLLTVGSVQTHERPGAMIRLTDAQGRVGYGELSPLQGRHKESLEDSIACLRESISRKTSPILPSAAFALSCARAVAVRDKKLGLGEPVAGTSVGINALFTGGVGEARSMTAAGLFSGFKTVKAKVGRSRVADDVATLQALLEGLDSSARLRLDGNRKFTLRTAQNLLKRLDMSRIEYIEEPLQDPREMPELHRLTGVSVAADESMQEPAERAFVVGSAGIEVQVLKPSLLGPLSEVLHMVTNGRIQGMDSVFSTAFESSYTIAIIARLASVASTGDRDHGLGTQGVFTHEFVKPWPIIDGRLQVDLPLPEPQLDFAPL